MDTLKGTLIGRLTNLFTIERIYLSHFQYKGAGVVELTILIPHSSKLHILEVIPLVNMAVADYHGIRPRVFYMDEARRALRGGNLVFYRICQPENLVYQRTGGTVDLITPDLTAKVILRHVKREFKKELKKISGFREGAAFYMEREDYPMAAFMLHQVIELCFRTAELLIVGRDKTSHSLRNHQKLMRRYVPGCGIIFNEEDAQEEGLLSLMDDAYRAVRYETRYKVDRMQVLAFFSKADLIWERLAELFELVVEEFKADEKI